MSQTNTAAATSRATISNVRSGTTHRWSQTLIPTTREAPNDAETPSHVLLSRAGFIRKVAAGVYDYLPLAWRTLGKISAIVREEMEGAGATELFMPVLVPIELYAGTKRDEAYGDLLFKLKDRKGNLTALGPTHEETITEMVKGSISSYKQLPLNLYQIQTKFRDEARPRAGLLRCREFIMKDAYSFHTTIDGAGGLNEAYDKMYTAYCNIFRRCGLDYTPVEAESGPIGGSASHEFMVNCESGEDTILRCKASGYAANVEKCEIGDRGAWTLDAAPSGELTEVHTPNLASIDEVGKFMKVKPDRMLKTIVFKVVAPLPSGKGLGEGSGRGGSLERTSENREPRLRRIQSSAEMLFGPSFPATRSMYPLPLRSYFVKPIRSRFLLDRAPLPFMSDHFPAMFGATTARRTGFFVPGCSVSASSFIDWTISNVSPVGSPFLSSTSYT